MAATATAFGARGASSSSSNNNNNDDGGDDERSNRRRLFRAPNAASFLARSRPRSSLLSFWILPSGAPKRLAKPLVSIY